MLPWENSDPCPVGETDCNNPYGEIVGTSGGAFNGLVNILIATLVLLLRRFGL
jgi:hypothetical protein